MIDYRRAAGVILLAVAVPSPIWAQDAQGLQGVGNYSLPSSRPTPSATPVPIPAAPVIVLPTPIPSATPTAAAPHPAATPSPRSTPTERPMPRPSATPEPAAPSPAATASPASVPSPAPTIATPAPSSTLTPSASVTPEPAVVASPALSGWPWWSFLTLALFVAAVIAAIIALRRCSTDDVIADDVVPVAYAVAVPDPVAPPAPAPAAARGRLDLSLRPVRAGLNMLSATVEAELTLVNKGEAQADAIRIGTTLLSAHGGQDADLAAAYDRPVARPAVPPFALAVGESRTVRIVAALPREAIRAMTAANRPMFVPILAVSALYRTVDGDAQTAQAFAVGIERVDSAKLAPFWLDVPDRMHSQVSARPHAAALHR